MHVRELAPGLWRWTALHPERTADDDCEPEVACTYYEAPDAIVLVDPLVPPEDSDRFLRALDRDVERAARSVHVLLSTPSHARSARQIADRYGAEIWVHGEGADLERAVAPTRAFGLDDALPGGVCAYPAVAGEVVLWIEPHGALVFPDVVVGDGRGGVALCPESWLAPERVSLDELRAALRPVLELPVERLLVSHGEPVLEGGRGALARALA